MTAPLRYDPARLRFGGCAGVGGIGSGIFFAAEGAHALGREESRAGHFLDRRDYCKLHIVSHYVKHFLGPAFPVLPIGAVGADAAGSQLLREMAGAGLDLRHVRTVSDSPTLFAVCIVYPDGSGGNLTENASAAAAVAPSDVAAAAPDLAAWGRPGIVMALPEAPLETRRALLGLGARLGCFRVASYTTAELLALAGDLDGVDLLALNLEEAAALARVDPEDDPERTIRSAATRLPPAALLTVTAGARGSWCWDGAQFWHRPALPVSVVSTAGAGDAHLAGALAGLALGLALADAHALAALTAAASVTSPHTIHPDLDAALLGRIARETGVDLPDGVRALLGEP
jgi:sugar/nucleoside kinase (ribokinase family)